MTTALDQFRPSLMYRWDVGFLGFIPWDGSLTAGTLTIGKVDQGTAGASAWLVTENPPASVLNGNKNVTTAGTRVTLAGSTSAKSVTVKAKRTNTGSIYVGDSSVSSANGFELRAGDSVSLDIANLQTVNLDASVSGEGVTFLGVV